MTQNYTISFADIPLWLEDLSSSFSVYAPKQEGSAVVYRPYELGSMPELAKKPTESAKHVVFPRSQELFRFRYAASPKEVGKRNVELQEVNTAKPSVIVGALSCDARGFFAFDPVYNGCGTKGLAKDVYYLRQRAQTLLIVLACEQVLNTCFCHYTGGSPSSAEGADVLATRLEHGLLLQAVSERGAELLQHSSIHKASEEQLLEGKAKHNKVEESLETAKFSSQNPEEVAQAILTHFDDLSFWQKQSNACLACGACTYLCPTCYCFNITDEGDGVSGSRLRSWDTCMSALFTLEASGHNPREKKAIRLKNRVGHKFSYYPQLHSGRFSCCGCGRCIKSCPSSIDIRKIVVNAIKTAHGKEGSRG